MGHAIDTGTYAPVSALAPRARPTKKPTGLSRITAFQSGHGWTSTGFGTVTLNDTSDFQIGTQAVKMVTTGSGNGTQISKTGLTAIDVTNKAFTLLVKCDDVTHLNRLTLQVGDGGNNEYNLDAIPLAASKIIQSGEWVPVRFGFRSQTSTAGTPPAKSAITGFTIKIQDDNTANPVTFHVQSLDITDDTTFPNGVVSITFDDCFQSTWDNGLARMGLYGFPATNYVICDAIGTTGRLTLAELQTLQSAHGWEIACHAFTQANHDLHFTAMTAAALDTECRQMKQYALDNNFRGADQMAYPGGFSNLATEAIVAKYFATARLTATNPRQTFPPVTPQRLTAEVAGNSGGVASPTMAVMQASIDSAKANRSWHILAFHKLVAAYSSDTSEMKISDFNTLIDYIATSGIPVMTVGDVMASL